ncbi:MAG: tRNA (guanosine(37)-N1)-methyltransferase TrmD [Clostridia bacterium]|nr:tRNA (guanosine(37)-N1)-methyltransferase TrmD [Clostridia bacterium]
MKIDIMTLFPEVCEAFLSSSIIGRARKKGILDIKCHQIRDFAFDKHKRVDDTPYGGGKGMVMMAEPIFKCFENICKLRGKRPTLIYMTPKGKVFNQKMAVDIKNEYDSIAILCGHYEGVDQRVIDEIVDKQISIGDYVLTGGEIPAVVFTDAVCRMVSGVLSEDVCFEDESHYKNLLEYPQYTKPAVWHDKKVPDVLVSGHHANIEKWKNEQSLEETKKYRPDILKK